ncbi:MAG: hypothetical protein ACREDS_02800 [Limisphaerales bacterium]
MKKAVAKLANIEGVFIGTSSRKYEGCFGQLYTREIYEYHGEVAKARFDRECLSEYLK